MLSDLQFWIARRCEGVGRDRSMEPLPLSRLPGVYRVCTGCSPRVHRVFAACLPGVYLGPGPAKLLEAHIRLTPARGPLVHFRLRQCRTRSLRRDAMGHATVDTNESEVSQHRGQSEATATCLVVGRRGGWWWCWCWFSHCVWPRPASHLMALLGWLDGRAQQVGQ